MTPFRRHRDGGDICAIFVHAGAGYHSLANEKHHLAACNDAARVAMTILKNGGEATDAVEMAIKLLEDREITNAGYGSNLTMSGQVECDATLVDHYGRSGAVGAVSQIQNPIGLARLVLNESTKPLSLQRVPPNLLVGPGATDFAYNKGMTVLPHDFLVSDGARDRWVKWKQDLRAADERESGMATSNTPQIWGPGPAMKANGTFSPPTSPDHVVATGQGLTQLHPPSRPLVASAADLTSPYPDSNEHRNAPDLAVNLQPGSGDWDHSGVATDDDIRWSAKRPRIDGSFDDADSPLGQIRARALALAQQPRRLSKIGEDHITDTVGAIAIDCFGNIAAGSSSGGIGMKHRGRCGPAALVGIGTAVVPMHPKDSTRTCIATVTSGTGEHMATTMAAQTAADRIYAGIRKKSNFNQGEQCFEMCNEEQALESMIKEDFMNHPGVRNSHCAGAIGVMTVKKTKDGIYLYFGHNTDSFALASMHSEERKPTCTMSRSTGNGAVAQGARAMKHRRHPIHPNN